MLVAISIPIFTSQLEKSRDSVSISNIRAAYAEASAACLTSNGGASTSGNVTTSVVANDKQTVTVTGIVLKGQANGFSGMEKELSFAHSTLNDTATEGGTPGTYTATFEFTISTGACALTELKIPTA